MNILKKCAEYKVAQNYIDKGIYPYFHTLESKQDAVVTMEGKRMIMLGSNNYLGLTVHPKVVEAGIKALEKYGTGCSGSRFMNGTLDLHIKLEKELAEFVNKEASMTFSTGYQSNLGIISGIASLHDVILCDRENHASIYDGCRLSYGDVLRYKHNDMEDLEKRLQSVPENVGCIIITDGVFSMSGDICNLPEIVRLAKKYDAAVMVDDAHGFGVLGEGGRGTADYFGLTDDVDIIMSTFSKSFASLGGFAAANKTVIDYLRHNARSFMFSASITPASCAAANAALDVIKEEPERVKKLADLADYMRDGLKKRGIKIKEAKTPIVPIYTYDDIRTLVVSKTLFERGVYVNPVLPPATDPKNCLIRTSLMATHTPEILDEAMDLIKEVLEEIK